MFGIDLIIQDFFSNICEFRKFAEVFEIRRTHVCGLGYLD